MLAATHPVVVVWIKVRIVLDALFALSSHVHRFDHIHVLQGLSFVDDRPSIT